MDCKWVVGTAGGLCEMHVDSRLVVFVMGRLCAWVVGTVGVFMGCCCVVLAAGGLHVHRWVDWAAGELTRLQVDWIASGLIGLQVG